MATFPWAVALTVFCLFLAVALMFQLQLLFEKAGRIRRVFLHILAAGVATAIVMGSMYWDYSIFIGYWVFVAYLAGSFIYAAWLANRNRAAEKKL